jgi:hypothetical protein
MPTSTRARLFGLVFAGLGFLIFAGNARAFGSGPPVLMQLSYYENGEHQPVRVNLVPGETASPAAGRPQEKWRLQPGQSIRMEQRPQDLTVELYKGKGEQHILLCAIAVRYYKNSDGVWVPHFLLIEQALLIPQNGRMVPLTQLEGSAGLIAMTGTALPNAEGFYPSLEFGLAQGLMQIDSWIIK